MDQHNQKYKLCTCAKAEAEVACQDQTNNTFVPEQQCRDEYNIRELEQHVEEQQKKLTMCKEEVEEWQSKFLRVTADFQNFQKRIEREQANWAMTAQKKLLLPILSIVDDFERALQGEPKAQDNAWASGIVMIYKSLLKFLQQSGVEEMKEYTDFDSTYHEAIMHVESDQHQSGQIVAVLQKGYLFKGEVVRPAQVSVAK